MAHRRGMTSRMLAMALAMLMIVTSLPQTALTAYAAEETVDASQSAPETELGGVVTSSDEATDNDNNAPADGENTPADEVDNPADDGKDPADGGDFFVEETPEEGTPEADKPAEEEAAPAEDEAPVEEDAAPTAEAEEAEVFEEMEATDPGAITKVDTNSYLMDTQETLRVYTTASHVGNWAVLYYKEQGAGSYTRGDWGEVHEENESDTPGAPGTVVYVAEVDMYDLTPDTNYEYKIFLGTDGVSFGDEMPDDSAAFVIDSSTGTFTTRESMRSFTGISAEAGINSVAMQAEFTCGREYYDTLYAWVSFRESSAGSSDPWTDYYASPKEISGYFRQGIDKKEFLLRGDPNMKAGTSYDYQVVINTDHSDKTAGMIIGTQTGSFETKADTRKITGASAQGGATSAIVTAEYTGAYNGDQTVIAVYVREDGASSAFDRKTNIDDEAFYQASGPAELTVTGLAEEKDYECIAVLWKNSTPESTFAEADEGKNEATYSASNIMKFSTKKEGRKLGTISTTETFTKVKFEVPYTDSYQGERTFASVYYRKNGTDDPYVPLDEDNYYDSSIKAADTLEINGYGLAKKTKYDYIVVLSAVYPDSFSQDALKAAVGSEAAKAAGILDKKTGDFTTKDESRTATKPTFKAGYTSVKVTSGFTGGIEGERSYMTFFYREKGVGNWIPCYLGYYDDVDEDYYEYVVTTGASSKKVTFTIGSLKVDKTYEVAAVLADGEEITAYPVSDADKTRKISEATDEFTTKKEGRKLTNVAVGESYTSANIRAGFEGNLYGDNINLYVFYRKNGTTGPYTAEMMYVPAYEEAPAEKADVTVTLSELEKNTKYDYVVVLFDNWDAYAALTGGSDTAITEALGKLDAGWVKKGDFTTLAASYDVTVAYDEAKSDIGYTVLNVALTADSAKDLLDNVITAELTLKTTDTAKPIETKKLSVALRNTLGYKAVLESKTLTPGTEYVVSQIDLKVSGSVIQTLTKDGDGYCKFTTKAAVEPTALKVPADVYLTLYGGTKEVAVSLTPENASTANLEYKVDPEGFVTVTGPYAPSVWKGTDVIGVAPNGKIGEATVKVVSTLAPDKELATFKVHVADYMLAEVPEAGASPTATGPITIEKGESTKELAVYARTKEGDPYAKVEGDATLVEGKNIVSWAENKLTGINKGSSMVVLKAGEYSVSVSVNVTIKNKGFLITGLKNTTYPAIIKEAPAAGGFEATVAAGQEYTIEGFLSPVNEKLTNSNITKLDIKDDPNGNATVAGNVITVGSSDAEIKVAADGDWTKQTATIKLHVLPVPTLTKGVGTSMGLVLTNVAKTLKDVPLDEGWKWDDDESTPLFTADVRGAGASTKEFTASYVGKENNLDKYPVKSQKVKLDMTTMTSAFVIPSSSVVQLKGGTAAVSFTFDTDGAKIDPQNNYGSLIGDSKYVYKLSAGSDVVLSDYTAGSTTQTATFSKDGTYDFTLDVLSGAAENPATIMTAKTTVKVVKEAQVYSIDVKDATYGDKAALDAASKAACLSMEYTVTEEEAAKKGLILTVEAKDDENKVITDTKLEWRSSDPSVASVTTDETTRIATIKPGKEQGHTTISIKAKDDKGFKTFFTYEYQNRAPRVETTSVKVNLAYDTSTAAGRDMAYNKYGSKLEIVPVYGMGLSDIVNVKLYDRTAKTKTFNAETTKTERKDFGVTYQTGQAGYVVTSSADAKPGKHNLWMVVTVSDDAVSKNVEHAYPLTITAAVKKPAVSIKASGKINLFYINRVGQENIDVSLNSGVYSFSYDPVISWKDDSNTAYGFDISTTYTGWDSKGNNYIWKYGVAYPNVRVNNRKLADKNVDKGTVTVTLPGIRKEYGGVVEKKGVKIATTYKKPVLAAIKPSSSIIKEAGINTNRFDLKNKTDNIYMYQTGNAYYSASLSYETMTSNTPGVTFTPGGTTSSYVNYTYTGSKKSEKLILTLDNAQYWREPLTVAHTIKNIKPKAVLSRSVITTNTNLDDLYVNDTYIKVKLDGKDTTTISLSDVEIQASGKKEKPLVDNNFINFYATGGGKNTLYFNQNALKALDGTLSKGSYKFKITPYYTATDGTVNKLNTLTLAIKVADPMSLKLSAKGSLDIAKRSLYSGRWNKSKWVPVDENVVKLKPKFANYPTGAYVSDYDYKLKGQYADYFGIYRRGNNIADQTYYVGFEGVSTYGTSAYNKKLKAGMTIPLTVEYTIKAKGIGGDYEVAVLSATINVKITESTPKVKVKSGNNQILYAATDTFERYATIEVPSTSKIYDVTGGLDCDNDGYADIIVYDNSISSNTADLTIRVQDMDAVFASSKGKVLSIPVKVKVTGSDGTVKDATTVIKVKVKR